MDCESAPAYTALDPKNDEGKPTRWRGVSFALLAVLVSVGSSASTRLVGAAQFTPYFVNLVHSCLGALVMLIFLSVRQSPLIERFPGWFTWAFLWGGALWFAMWGMVRSLRRLDLATWQSLTECMNQVFITAASAIFLGEKITAFKTMVVCRNLCVVILVTQPPFLFGGKTNPNIVVGLAFIIVQALGSAGCVVLQRFLRDRSVENLLLFGYLWNVLYWFPPGFAPPEIRVEDLWPTTPYDASNPMGQSLGKWMSLFMGGLCGGFVYICIGYGVRYIDGATFFFIATPLNLGLAALVNCFAFGESLGQFKIVALVIIAAGFIFDQWYETRAATCEQAKE